MPDGYPYNVVIPIVNGVHNYDRALFLGGKLASGDHVGTRNADLVFPDRCIGEPANEEYQVYGSKQLSDHITSWLGEPINP